MPRLEIINVFRALLAWSVVAVHLLAFANIVYLVPQGQWVVNIFIIISGFVITMLLVDKQEPYRTFITRRLYRLLPVYFVCLGLALLLRPLVIGTFAWDHAKELDENTYFWQHIFAHLSMTFTAIPEAVLPHSGMALLTPAWSIGLELQLYLLAPLIVWLRSKHPSWIWVLFLGSLLALPRRTSWPLDMYYSPIGAFFPQRLYLFMIGGLLYWYTPWRRVLCLALPKWLDWLKWLGQISYPTYLVHYPILQLFNSIMPSNWLWLVLTVVPATIAASAFLHYLIEKPFIRIGARNLNPSLKRVKGEPKIAALT